MSSVAAIHNESRSSDPSRTWSQEERDGVRDIQRLAEAKRMHFSNRGKSFFSQHLLGFLQHSCVHETWSNAVDANTITRQFQGQCFGHSNKRSLRRTINSAANR